MENDLDELGNRLINEENNYDRDLLKDEHMTIHNKLNPDQRNAFTAIIVNQKRIGKTDIC